MPYFGGLYAIFLWKSLDFNRLLCHTDPHCMACFGGIFFANMGGGGGQNYFQKIRPDLKGTRLKWHKPETARDKFLILYFRNPNLGRKQILGARNFGPEFLGRFLIRFFPAKEAPQKITLQKFTSLNSPSKIQPSITGAKLHIAPLQGCLAEKLLAAFSWFAAVFFGVCGVAVFVADCRRKSQETVSCTLSLVLVPHSGCLKALL